MARLRVSWPTAITGVVNYQRAESLLDRAMRDQSAGVNPVVVAQELAAAQVYATLALVAATVRS